MLIDEIHRLGLHIKIVSISLNPNAVDFLVTSLPNYPNVHIRMEPDNHPPHLHVSVGNRAHCASFALDGTFLTGNLERKQMAYVQEWICIHHEKLIQLWNIVKNGEDYSQVRREIIWEDFKFDGKRPEYYRKIDGVDIWYNGELTQISTDSTDSVKVFSCIGNIHVVYPNRAKKNLFEFFSEEGTIQERILGTR